MHMNGRHVMSSLSSSCPCMHNGSTEGIKWMSRCAGVPVTRPVAGVAMGLMLEQDGQFKILTDILGSEDAMGDMDFKVAGDADAITAFQMDIKVRLM